MQLHARELKLLLERVPNDAKIVYQRIEDTYFENNNWESIKMEWQQYPGDRLETEYIRAFQAYYLKEENLVVIDAHH